MFGAAFQFFFKIGDDVGNFWDVKKGCFNIDFLEFLGDGFG